MIKLYISFIIEFNDFKNLYVLFIFSESSRIQSRIKLEFLSSRKNSSCFRKFYWNFIEHNFSSLWNDQFHLEQNFKLKNIYSLHTRQTALHHFTFKFALYSLVQRNFQSPKIIIPCIIHYMLYINAYKFSNKWNFFVTY